MRRWFSARGDAVVGYVEVAGLRVAAGAPIAAEQRLGAVAEEFEVTSLAAGKQVCYFAAESRLLELAHHRRYARHLLGLQPTWRAASWGERFDACASLRAQRNRARNKGVSVTEVDSARERDTDLRSCHEAWLASKGLPQLRFVAHSDPASLARSGGDVDALADRRLFIATARDEIIGYLSAAPVPRRRGWLVEKIVRRPQAPNGTAELLVDTALRKLAGDAERFTLGLSPLATRRDGHNDDRRCAAGPDDGAARRAEGRAEAGTETGPAWLEIAKRLAMKRGRGAYDFAGLYSFKSKFRPESWEPVYLLSTEERLTLRTFVAVAGAFLGTDRQALDRQAPPQRGWWSMPS